MPKWEETVLGARTRYVQVIETLSNKYPNENLLLVTHGKASFNFPWLMTCFAVY